MTEFKVGDRVQLTKTKEEMCDDNGYDGKLSAPHIGVVTKVGYHGEINIDGEGAGCWMWPIQVKAVPNYPNPPHKHAELIKAWADGASIEAIYPTTKEWYSRITPGWLPELDYRIKPEKSDKDIKLEQLEETARKLADEIKALRNE